jgi:predicted  nucleic acid-binding Zn-ribbon protein
VELAAAHIKVAEVERHERSLTSDYDSLHRDFSDLTSHIAIVKEKADLEKTEHEKAQRFHNLLRKKLAGLRHDMEESIAALEG